MEKRLERIFISIFIFIIAILIQNICKAVSLTTDYYKINNEEKIIYAIEPETDINSFKIRLSGISSETGIKD